jgi:hypothetical protein
MIVNAFHRGDMLDEMDPIRREHHHVQKYAPSSLSGMRQTDAFYRRRTGRAQIPMCRLQE